MVKETPKDQIMNHFIKHVESSNIIRANAFKARRDKSLIVALAAAAFAVGSYLFSINAVRQGRYLDESFDKLPDPK